MLTALPSPHSSPLTITALPSPSQLSPSLPQPSPHHHSSPLTPTALPSPSQLSPHHHSSLPTITALSLTPTALPSPSQLSPHPHSSPLTPTALPSSSQLSPHPHSHILLTLAFLHRTLSKGRVSKPAAGGQTLMMRKGPLKAAWGRDGHATPIDNFDDPSTRNEDPLVCHDNMGWARVGGEQSSCSGEDGVWFTDGRGSTNPFSTRTHTRTRTHTHTHQTTHMHTHARYSLDIASEADMGQL